MIEAPVDVCRVDGNEALGAEYLAISDEDRHRMRRGCAKTYQIAIGNGRLYGGGNVVEQTASIDDGSLDLYSLEMRNLWKLALMVRAFRTGTRDAWKEVRTARCVEFDIETRRPMPINTDGEIVTATPAHFKFMPGAITVIAPAGASTQGAAVRLFHR